MRPQLAPGAQRSPRVAEASIATSCCSDFVHRLVWACPSHLRTFRPFRERIASVFSAPALRMLSLTLLQAGIVRSGLRCGFGGRWSLSVMGHLSSLRCLRCRLKVGHLVSLWAKVTRLRVPQDSAFRHGTKLAPACSMPRPRKDYHLRQIFP